MISPKKRPKNKKVLTRLYQSLMKSKATTLLELALVAATLMYVSIFFHLDNIQKSSTDIHPAIRQLNELPSSMIYDNERCGSMILSPLFLERKYINRMTKSDKGDFEGKKHVKVFVNRNEKTFQRRKLYSSCVFTPQTKENNGPVPVLFLSNGRSGSSAIWTTLSVLSGEKSEAMEVFGSDEKQVKKFLKSMKSEEEGSWWLSEHLCETTKRNCNSTIAGIQWKPYVNSWTLPSAQGILKQIARHNHNVDANNKPTIKVLFLTRNPLDVIISQTKHRHFQLKAHCKKLDLECIKNNKVQSMALPTDTLLRDLKKSADQVKLVRNTLESFEIDYYLTTYEDLYNRDDAEEWMKIFRYFGRGPMENLTLENIQEASTLSKSNETSREKKLSNYEEVKKLLEGTEFSHLLDE